MRSGTPQFFFRPFGASSSNSGATHGLRRGLHSIAASRLDSERLKANKTGVR